MTGLAQSTTQASGGKAKESAHGQRRYRVTLAVAAWAAGCLGGSVPGRLTTVDLCALASVLAARTLRPGNLVHAAGTQPEGVWIIRSGAVEIGLGSGAERVVATVLRANDVFGDLPLLARQPLPLTPIARQPTTCLLLPAVVLGQLLANHPAIAQIWLAGLASRFANNQLGYLDTLPGPLSRRVARLLLREQRDGQVDLPQATLAGMLGVARPSLNRLLRRLEAAEVLGLRYRQIRLLDVDRLAAMAQGVRQGSGSTWD
jgi:CRP-like cAMP-binding protein